MIHVPFLRGVDLRRRQDSIDLIPLADWGWLGWGPGQFQASIVFRVVDDAVTAPLVVVRPWRNACTPAAVAAVLVHVLADELNVSIVLCERAAQSLSGLQRRAEGWRNIVVDSNSVSADTQRCKGNSKD